MTKNPTMKALKEIREQIHATASAIIQNSTEVSLDDSHLDYLVEKIKNRPNKINTNTNDQNIPINRQLGLIVAYSPIHYCFTNPESKLEYRYNDQGIVLKRSTGFITALKKSNIEWENFSSVKMTTIEEWHSILQTSDESILFELDERLRRLKSLMDYFSLNGINTFEDFDSKYINAESIILFLLGSGLFNDIFLKRAQVTTYLLNATRKFYELPEYEDISLLTAMPDYRLPQLLYNLGIVKIDENLRNRLSDKTTILKNSNEEILLRASVIVVAEEISKQLKLDEADIDSLMWGFSQDLINSNEMKIPAMLVKTNCY